MPRWEYSAIDGVYRKSGEGPASYYGGLSHFTAGGIRRLKLMDGDSKALAQAVSQLGEEGWEMAGCGSTASDYHILYCKRPKP